MEPVQALAVRLGEEHEAAAAALQQQQELQQAVLEELLGAVKADCQARIQGARGTTGFSQARLSLPGRRPG
jgi:hypothetical protein